MNKRANLFAVAAASMALFAVGCGEEGSSTAPNEVPSETSEPEEQAIAEERGTADTVAVFPRSLNVFGDGYPKPGDPCRRLGESAATIDWLDDSAVLVGCPSPEDAAKLGGKFMGAVDGFTVISVSTGDANPGIREIPMQSPVGTQPPPKRPIASASEEELEAKCKAEVESTTGATVLSTISSDFSQAGTLFMFAVQGAQAPWQCIGYSNGTVAGVMYTGDEGSL